MKRHHQWLLLLGAIFHTQAASVLHQTGPYQFTYQIGKNEQNDVQSKVRNMYGVRRHSDELRLIDFAKQFSDQKATQKNEQEMLTKNKFSGHPKLNKSYEPKQSDPASEIKTSFNSSSSSKANSSRVIKSKKSDLPSKFQSSARLPDQSPTKDKSTHSSLRRSKTSKSLPVKPIGSDASRTKKVPHVVPLEQLRLVTLNETDQFDQENVQQRNGSSFQDLLPMEEEQQEVGIRSRATSLVAPSVYFADGGSLHSLTANRSSIVEMESKLKPQATAADDSTRRQVKQQTTAEPEDAVVFSQISQMEEHNGRLEEEPLSFGDHHREMIVTEDYENEEEEASTGEEGAEDIAAAAAMSDDRLLDEVLIRRLRQRMQANQETRNANRTVDGEILTGDLSNDQQETMTAAVRPFTTTSAAISPQARQNELMQIVAQMAAKNLIMRQIISQIDRFDQQQQQGNRNETRPLVNEMLQSNRTFAKKPDFQQPPMLPKPEALKEMPMEMLLNGADVTMNANGNEILVPVDELGKQLSDFSPLLDARRPEPTKMSNNQTTSQPNLMTDGLQMSDQELQLDPQMIQMLLGNSSLFHLHPFNNQSESIDQQQPHRLTADGQPMENHPTETSKPGTIRLAKNERNIKMTSHIRPRLSLQQLLSESMPSMHMSVQPVVFFDRLNQRPVNIPFLVIRSVTKVPLLPNFLAIVNGRRRSTKTTTTSMGKLGKMDQNLINFLRSNGGELMSDSSSMIRSQQSPSPLSATTTTTTTDAPATAKKSNQFAADDLDSFKIFGKRKSIKTKS